MVSRVSRNSTKILYLTAVFLLSFAATIPIFADDRTKMTDFNVNIKEVLSVSVSTPTDWAVGDIDTFLRNKVNVSVISNNTAGFTASMTMKTSETSLINNAKNTYTLPTLTSSTTRSDFPANYWGYSFDDTEAGNNVSTYSKLVGINETPITIISTNSASSGSKDFYFGAKANTTQAAGTYTGTVVINVVSGVIDDTTNPITPTDPIAPVPTPNTPTYDNSRNATAYTYNTVVPNTNTSTTTTEISSGDTRGVYDGYTPPQGVMNYSITARLSGISATAAGLTVAATIAAASGAFLFFAARREDDDEDSDENML